MRISATKKWWGQLLDPLAPAIGGDKFSKEHTGLTLCADLRAETLTARAGGGEFRIENTLSLGDTSSCTLEPGEAEVIAHFHSLRRTLRRFRASDEITLAFTEKTLSERVPGRYPDPVAYEDVCYVLTSLTSQDAKTWAETRVSWLTLKNNLFQVLPPAGDPQWEASVGLEQLAGATGRVLRACSQDETRMLLNNAQLRHDGQGHWRLASTDTHRLHVTEWEDAWAGKQAPEFDLILPIAVVRWLAKRKGGTATLRRYKSFLSLEDSGVTVSVKPHDGEFPNFFRAIPKDDKITWRITVISTVLRDAAWRLSWIAGDNGYDKPKVFLRHSDAGLTLSLYQEGFLTEETIPAREVTVQGDFTGIALSPEYLVDALDATPDGCVCLAGHSSLNPVRLTGGSCGGWVPGESVAVLMPMGWHQDDTTALEAERVKLTAERGAER